MPPVPPDHAESVPSWWTAQPRDGFTSAARARNPLGISAHYPPTCPWRRDAVRDAVEAIRPSRPPRHWYHVSYAAVTMARWPLPNVWLGVSAEDQPRADERILSWRLRRRRSKFVSLEPLLGPIDLTQVTTDAGPINALWTAMKRDAPAPWSRLDWVIVGGESGPGARPCALEWIEDIVRQCRNAAVPVFVKQLGAFVVSEERTCGQDVINILKPHVARRMLKAPNGEYWAWRAGLRDPKGGDHSEWPEDLRIREFSGASK